MSFKEQLQRIREENERRGKNSLSLLEEEKQPDLLFYQEVQENLQIFKRAHSDMYSKNRKYFDHFLGEKSKSFRRERITENENASLSKRVSYFIRILTPYAVYRYTQVLVEWLLRRYLIEKYEYMQLLVFGVCEKSLLEGILEKAYYLKMRETELLDGLRKEYTVENLARCIGKHSELSMYIIGALEEIIGDGEGLQYMLFYEKVLEKIAEKEMFTEETLSLWVSRLVSLRETMEKEGKDSLIYKSLVMAIERILHRISERVDLSDEYVKKISSFLIADEKENESEEEDSLTRFDISYLEFKRTGEYTEILRDHKMEFLKQLLKEELTAENMGKDDIIVSTVIQDLEDNKEEMLTLVFENDRLLQHLRETPYWNKIKKKNPSLDAMYLLVAKEIFGKDKERLISSKALEEVFSLLPNKAIERKLLLLIRKIESREKLQLIIKRVSLEVLEEAAKEIELWSDFCFFVSLRPEALSRVLRQINMEIIIENLLDFVMLMDSLSESISISKYLFPEQVETVKSILIQAIENADSHIPGYTAFASLLGDISLSTEYIIRFLEVLIVLPKKEKLRKKCIKTIFKILETRCSEVKGDFMHKALSLFSLAEVDLSLSLSFFRMLNSLDMQVFDSDIILSLASLKLDKYKKMYLMLLEENYHLIHAVYIKYADKLSEKELLWLLEAKEIDLVALIIRKRFSNLSEESKRVIIEEALKRIEKKEESLFLCLKEIIPIDNWISIFLSIDSLKSSHNCITSLLNGLLDQTEYSKESALLLLIHARRLALPEDSLSKWEEKIVSEKDLLSRLIKNIHQKTDTHISKGMLKRYLKRGGSSTDLLSVLVEEEKVPSVLKEVLMHNPESKEKLKMLKRLLRHADEENSLVYSLEILKDKKSKTIRYFVQRYLPRILSLLLKQTDKHPLHISHILGNLLKREKNVMSPYIPQILHLIKTTKKRSLLSPLAKMSPRYIIASVKNTPKDLIILKEYIKLRKSLSEEFTPADKENILKYYIENISLKPSARALVEFSSLLEHPKEMWIPLLRKTKGVSQTFIDLLSNMLPWDTEGLCISNLDIVYSKLEDLLIDLLKAPNQKVPNQKQIIDILTAYYTHEKGSLIRTKEISSLLLDALSNNSSFSLLLSSLFLSRTKSLPSEAEEMNHMLLKRIIEHKTNEHLFSGLKEIYQMNSSFMGRVLGQSAPYFSLLLESNNSATREQAESLMETVKATTGIDPFTYL
ncbi:hypothetical protein NEFER03_0459 [Nematocida sp. LUAm3]|nr:hypothetical protein NEFER03_0459 [Nematocida sp. LUAm3]KAI5175916.1 hypothetical protein NEFER02_1776 [Nematocida sp. LUAm2]KAI5178702.1 hypothetical protein NEFER01_1821 [Nematocida sp. LUAm1]